MKIKIITLLAIFSLALSGYAQNNTLVLTVDIEKVLRESQRIQDALGDLQREAQNAGAELERMQEQRQEIFNKAREQHALSINPALTEDAKQKATEEIAGLEQQLIQLEETQQQFQQQTQQELGNRRNSILGTYFEEIRQVVISLAEQKNAALVLNSNQAVLYAKETLDITKEVQDLLYAAP